MASLASGAEGLAVATVVPASNALRYVFISCGESQSYFVRSDGAVDRSTVSLHLPPPTHQPPSRFSARTFPSFVHSVAHLRTHLLARSLKQGGGKVSHTINPPPGTKFIAASPEFSTTNENHDLAVPRPEQPELPFLGRPYKAVVVIFFAGAIDS